MDIDESSKDADKPDDKPKGKTRRRSRGHYYNHLVYYKGNKGKTYFYQYFKPYTYDYRMLHNDEKGEPIECLCPKGEIHLSKCPWYNPDIIYVLDNDHDLSISEQAAQQKIYNMYQNTTNNSPEICGCGTAAAIAYMGHNTGFVEFQHLYERESFEVLLAILKKRKKVTFADDADIETKRPRLDSTVENEVADDDQDDKDAVSEVQKIPRAKELKPTLSHVPTDSLSVLADAALATSADTHPNTLPNSLPDVIEDAVGGADCPCTVISSFSTNHVIYFLGLPPKISWSSS